MPKRSRAKIRVATCQFSESYHPRRNAAIVRRYIAAAKKRRADVVHFHECCLSGYAGKINDPDYDWDALREATESVLAEAKRRKVWVILGCSHPLAPPHKPHNSLYVISPAGKIVDRYDKRFCTSGDLKSYSPGDHFVVFKINGIKCSALICYDVRFPELYRELYKLGVKVLFQSFHNAGGKPGDHIHEHIMRQTLQGHAGVNAFWASANNSSAYYSRWSSVFITPDGKIVARLKRNRPGMMVNTVDTGFDYYDASADFRDDAIGGKLNAGKCVKDRRSADRTCY